LKPRSVFLVTTEGELIEWSQRNRWTYLGRPPFAALCMRQPGIALRDLNSVGSLFVRTEVCVYIIMVNVIC
jgi:hypothetical protein